jgi:biotin transport system substrate-specific component
MAMSYSYVAQEAVEGRSWLKEIAIVLTASVIIALCKPIAIHLPFSPVPIAVQAHVILLLSCFLGSKRAALTVLAFLCQGAWGLPVFASGRIGLLAFMGPTGGFLVGYLFAAFCTGYFMERVKDRTPLMALLAMGLGNLVVYLFGIPWLAVHIGWQSSFVLGMLPFLLPDLLKLIVAERILKGLRYSH